MEISTMRKQPPAPAGSAQRRARGAVPAPSQGWQDRQRLGDRLWNRIEAALPGRVGARSHNGGNARRFVEAVLWVAQSRAYWCDIPAEYGQWHTLYIRFGRWCDEGRWNNVIAELEGQPEMRDALRGLVDRYCANVSARRARRRG